MLAETISAPVTRDYAQLLIARSDGIDLRAKFLWPGIRSPRQVRPEVALAIRSVGGVQRRAVASAIDWLNSAESSGYRLKGWQLSR